MDGPKVAAGGGVTIDGLLGREKTAAAAPAARPPRAVLFPDPYPQVLDEGKPDLLVASYGQVADDSKPVLSDHLVASGSGGVLQAPSPL